MTMKGASVQPDPEDESFEAEKEVLTIPFYDRKTTKAIVIVDLGYDTQKIYKYPSMSKAKAVFMDEETNRCTFAVVEELARNLSAGELQTLYRGLIKSSTPKLTRNKLELAKKLWPLLDQVAEWRDPWNPQVRTEAEAPKPGVARRSRVTETQRFKVTGKVPEPKALPKQAVQLIDIIKKGGDRGFTMNELILHMRGIIKTKQPIERIFKYYKKRLIDEGYIATYNR